MKKRLSNLAMLLVPLASLGTLAAIYLVIRHHNSPLPLVRDNGVRVICVGDSITYGAGLDSSSRNRTSYPARLQESLGNEYHVLNYGVSGTTLALSGDSPYQHHRAFRITRQVEPAIVLIMLGTNDTKPQNWNAQVYERQLVAFVNIYKALPSRPEVYLMSPPAAFANNFGINQTIIEHEVAPIVLRVAKQTNTQMIDVFSATKDHPEYFPDGVHPSEAGHEVIAATVRVALGR
jgi:lysophospholipase L1-like esterase